MGDRIDKNEKSRACSTNEEEMCVQGFGWGNLRERDHLGDSGVDGRIILNGTSGTGYRGMNRKEMARAMNNSRALVHSVMNLRVP